MDTSAISSFDKSKLKSTKTVEKTHLPTQDEVKAAKADPTESVALPVATKKWRKKWI